ncbi:putative zinc-binding metallopeptidase [Amycolatopsis sp. CA-126428]|uniref:putative zinc-binding metallopeptidase n=1 Tax=Amycolatopsis sp. CA-126428 TaxID=2073158 RepID=UPI000CD315C2
MTTGKRRLPASADRALRDRPRRGLERNHVSHYAAAHPWEDWTETFAHVRHIRNTVQTAAVLGVLVAGTPIASHSRRPGRRRGRLVRVEHAQHLPRAGAMAPGPRLGEPAGARRPQSVSPPDAGGVAARRACSRSRISSGV